MHKTQYSKVKPKQSKSEVQMRQLHREYHSGEDTDGKRAATGKQTALLCHSKPLGDMSVLTHQSDKMKSGETVVGIWRVEMRLKKRSGANAYFNLILYHHPPNATPA